MPSSRFPRPAASGLLAPIFGLGLGLVLGLGAASAQTAPAPAPRRPAQGQAAQAQPAQATPGQVQPGQAPAAGQPASGAPAVTFPGGASSVSEEHGDWTVNCSVQEARRVCGIAQAQGNRQTNRRLFAVELRPVATDRAEGALILPFGLRLANGARLELDDQGFGPDRGFSTCVEGGCLVPVLFDAAATGALQRGNALKINALNNGNGEVVSFSVSLNGFTSALRRARELAG